MNHWYVVHTRAQAEERAAFHLRRQEFEVYLPRYLRAVRHARRAEMRPAPLFPRYLFVRVDTAAGRWRAILSTVGVDQMICDGFGPLPVPDPVVLTVRQREAVDGYVVLQPDLPLRRGDAVVITSGPLAECPALFECLDDRQRAVLLMNILGRETRLRVAECRFAAA